MLRIGIGGFGFMGRMHYRCWNGAEGVKVAAICDANPDIVADTQKAVGNIEGADEAVDFSGIELYQDFDEMISKGNLDAVSITLPTHLHPVFSMKALAAGVHVLCEKPMALNTADCKQMIDSAKSSGKILQIGHCIRFWPEYAKAKEIVESGEYGKIIAATFQRLSAPPDWSDDNWLMDDERSGGVILDLHIHDTDFVRYLCGLPKAVCSYQAKNKLGGVAHIVTQYLYDDERVITAEGGWAMTPAFGFEMSFNIMLEKATIVYDCTRTPAFRVCPADGEVFEPEVEAGDGYSLEILHFAGRVKGEKLPEITTLEQSLDSVKIIQAEKQSANKGEKVLLK